MNVYIQFKMRSLLVVVGLLATTSIASVFDPQQFYSHYCYAFTYNNASSVQCSQFYLSQASIQAFQDEKFVISNATNVFLIGCAFGSLNENVVNKFPKATNIYIEQCTFNLDNVHSKASVVNTVLKSLTIEKSNAYGSGNITSFGMLTGLTQLSINAYLLEDSVIGSTIFANNTKLEYLEISNVQLTTIDANAFNNLKNLKTINITNTGLSALPYGLLKNNQNLITVVLSYNNLEFLPLPFFPSSVENIQMNNNILEVISAQTFKGLSRLSYLDLSGNSISVLSNAAFSSATNLTYLDLHNNQISKFDRKLFSQSKNLQTVYLYHNKFTTLPEDCFDDLGQLGIVIVNPVAYYG